MALVTKQQLKQLGLIAAIIALAKMIRDAIREW